MHKIVLMFRNRAGGMENLSVIQNIDLNILVAKLYCNRSEPLLLTFMVQVKITSERDTSVKMYNF